jgi:hypothetical protein
MSESMIEIALAATTTANGGDIPVGSADATSGSIGGRGIPAAIPADQAYYWSFEWQDDIRESMAALAAGDFVDFDSDDPNDVARWLLSPDDD